MKMRKAQVDIFKLLSNNETLLRLLIYLPSSAADDPLDPSKLNILDMEEQEKWKLINDRILFTPTHVGLDQDPKCRICFFHSRRDTNRSNVIANQSFNLDVFTHYKFNNVDQRLAWICDTLDEMFANQNITGIGKCIPLPSRELSAPTEYVGFRLVYEFGDFNG
jgi:hypothetical protein